MNDFLKPFIYFFYVQNFFKTKKIYFIFFLFTVGTLIEMLNIGIILPFLNVVFNLDSISISDNKLISFFWKYVYLTNHGTIPNYFKLFSPICFNCDCFLTLEE